MVYELGETAGTGAAFKMINQLLAGVHIAAACEAIAFAAKQRAGPRQSIRGDHRLGRQFPGCSRNRIPHVLAGDYAPLSASRFFVKDLGIVQDMARAERYPVPLVAGRTADVSCSLGHRHGARTTIPPSRALRPVSGATLPGTNNP